MALPTVTASSLSIGIPSKNSAATAFADMMRGPEGSLVSLTIDRGNGPQVVSMPRRRVEIPSVDEVQLVDRSNGIGYIKLTNFQKTTARDFDQALWQLSRQGMRSLIVDVRGNPGGLLTASVEVADRFIRQGIIVSTKGRNPLEDFVHQASAEKHLEYATGGAGR